MSTRTLCCLWVLFLFSAFVFSAPGYAAEKVPRDQTVESDSPEAWAMFYTTAITLPAGLGTPQHREPGSVAIGLEAGSIPSLSKSERTVGLGGTKEEDLNKSPVFGRPSVIVGLPADFSLVLGYVPPLRVYGVRPNLFSVMLERPLLQGSSWDLGGRAYAQAGTVQGDFTCSKNVTSKPPGSPGNPYGCEAKSSDEANQRYAGFELSGSYHNEALHGVSPWVAVSANFLDTKVHVNAETFNIVDRTRLVADSWIYGFSAGVSYPINEQLDVTAGMFYTPLQVRRDFAATSSDSDDFLNFRATVRYRLP